MLEQIHLYTYTFRKTISTFMKCVTDILIRRILCFANYTNSYHSLFINFEKTLIAHSPLTRGRASHGVPTSCKECNARVNVFMSL